MQLNWVALDPIDRLRPSCASPRCLRGALARASRGSREVRSRTSWRWLRETAQTEKVWWLSSWRGPPMHRHDRATHSTPSRNAMPAASSSTFETAIPVKNSGMFGGNKSLVRRFAHGTKYILPAGQQRCQRRRSGAGHLARPRPRPRSSAVARLGRRPPRESASQGPRESD